ncbi:hypothetical protein ORM40_26360 [Bacillus cereus]|uniref:hypothetical protein n=1 Tax=Bacillus cereus TaxID=1396 RepID=UPI002AC1F0B0|nr:hypothetical protein [Bacillus cereus]MDZ4508197.1 hypothetical protein [Bacillus cereus]
MYFENSTHEQNYNEMMKFYSLSFGENPAFESAIYIAAYSQIHDKISKSKMNKNANPLEIALESDYLSNSAESLVLLGQSLFKGEKVDVSSVVTRGKEIFEIFVQACKIRGCLN